MKNNEIISEILVFALGYIIGSFLCSIWFFLYLNEKTVTIIGFLNLIPIGLLLVVIGFFYLTQFKLVRKCD